MSTASAPVPPVTIDVNRPGIPFARLVGVEWRKMLDTRAGAWLMGVTFGLVVLTIGLLLLTVALNDDFPSSASTFAGVLQFVLLLIVPVFAIIITTGEWGQRNHLTLFTLEPRRGRVIAAKFCAVLIFAAATLVFSIVMGALGNVIGGAIDGGGPTWDYGWDDLGWSSLIQVVLILSAFSLGLLLLNSAAAVAIFYVIAILLRWAIYPILMGFFGWFRDVAPYIDIFYGVGVLSSGTSIEGDSLGAFGQVAPFITGVLIWVVLPGVLGTLRALKSEIK